MGHGTGAVAYGGLAAAVEQAADGIVITDPKGKIQYVNPAFTAITGYTAEQAVGQNPSFLKSGQHPEEFYEELWSTVLSGKIWQGEITNRRKDGTLYQEEMRIAPVTDEQGTVTGFIAIKHDVTERRARESAQAFLAAIVEHSEDAIIATTPAGVILTWNHGAEVIFGFTAEGAIGRDVSLFTPPDRMDRVTAFVGRVFQGEVLSNYRGISQRADGRRIHVSVTGFPLRDAAGKVVAITAILRDSSESDRAAEKLAESEERFRTMADSNPSIMWVTDARGEAEFINRAYRKFFGTTCEEIRTGRWQQLIHPEDAAEYGAAFARGVTEHLSFEAEARVRRGDGEWRLLGSRAEPRFSPSGEFLGHVGLSADITDRRHTEEALRESEERFRIMADSCPIGIWVTDAEGRTRFSNRAYRDFFGMPSDPIEADGWRALIHPGDAPEFFRALDQSLKEHTPFAAERRSRRGDGQWRWLESLAAPRFSPSGEFLGLVGASKDITDRKRTEQALHTSEEKFRQLAENIHEVFWMMNAEGTEILYVAPAYEQIWGRSCASLYANPMDWMEAIHPADRETAHEIFMRQLQGETIDSEYRILTPGGQEKWIRDRAFPVRDPNGELIRIAGIAEEFTDRKQADQALRTSEERFRQLAENIRDVFRILPITSGESLYVSPAYEQIWGRSLESIYQDPASWREAIHPEDREQAEKMAVQQLLGNHVEVEYRIQTPNGQEKWIRDRAFPVRDADGQLSRVVGIAEEITEQKRYQLELIRLRQEADTANRAKSRFLANMSHEIRTPMNGVIGMNQLLLGTELTAEQRQFVEVAQDSGRTLLVLIDDILDLAKIENGKMVLENASFDLPHTVEDVIRLLSERANSRGLLLEMRLSPKIPRVLRGDAHRLRQILTNLTANAIKFTERGGVTLDAELESVGDRRTTVRFAITDTGIGIAEEQIRTLFSPFVQADASTTRRYGGTGLGLAISKQLVERMGGRIGVDSRPGGGSKFWFTATFETAARDQRSPVSERVPEGVLPADRVRPGHGERILVAEDNFTNRQVILAQLGKLGYKGVAVSDGAQAFEAVLQGGYDLVLMDCSMPVMDGYEATHLIRQSAQASIPIVALTASAMATDRERCLAEGMDEYLAKPVELPRLAEVLAKWLPQSRRVECAETTPDPDCAPAVLVFDVDSVLRRLMGDTDLAGIIFKAFLEDAPQRLEQLRARLAEKEARCARLHAHALKGAAANVGGEALRQAAHAMEMAADAGDLETATRAVPDLEAKLLELMDAIRQH